MSVLTLSKPYLTGSIMSLGYVAYALVPSLVAAPVTSWPSLALLFTFTSSVNVIVRTERPTQSV